MGYKGLPIFGLTASMKRTDYQELGFDDWLPKPILMDDLQVRLQSLNEREEEEADLIERVDRRWGWARN
jgi:DNA-binding response OmpR family regulator